MVAFDPTQVVGAGGALGALLRTYVNRRVDDENYPLGTLAVNVLGSFVLGALTFVGAGEGFMLLLGTGVCGSFTTFSSFSVETIRLWEHEKRMEAAVNAVVNLLGSLCAIGLAWVLV